MAGTGPGSVAPETRKSFRVTATTPGTFCMVLITSLAKTGCPKLRLAKENVVVRALVTAASTLAGTSAGSGVMVAAIVKVLAT